MTQLDTAAGYRQLDIAIAGLLGLEVLGEAPCHLDARGNWYVFKELDFECTMQSVYLLECKCNLPVLGYKYRQFGHDSRCLQPVPFYHRSGALARQALEQICDERDLTPLMTRTGSRWMVKLSRRDETIIAWDYNKSFPLAICKALAGLAEVAE